MEESGVGENNNKHLVDRFCEFTSSSREEASFFLESHNWNLDSALSTYVENNNLGFNDDDTTNDFDPLPPRPLQSPSPLIPPPTNFQSTTVPMSSRDKKPSKPSGSRTGGIRTLSDLNRASGPGSDDDSDGPQEYYTGGEKSGMLVQDPSKVGNDVDAIFSQARQLGAVEGPVESLHPSSSSRSFAGTGRLLSGEPVESAPQPPEAIVHNIVFWANGFTVNDGPLRRFDDPENASFLKSIRNSECPEELEPADRSSAVHVNLIRREQNCPEPEKRHLPFQGVGRTLGSSTSTAAPGPSPPVNSAPPPSMGLVVDENLPSTSIQLRLADGTRMVTRFNHHHTISDIRAFIDSSRPGGAGTYQLQTVGFPPKQLTNVTQTIEQAGLANSVVIQKF
ncbi:plant UBX domain-containing protein 4-like [Macadamia integrifolia]|uniref:plant UBX domain-containing protein 4-like n=1 Tax=Macadamia integrifolia TaxID=60698 RepID=UPI001C532D57|nr:plant UBX domain-containing protein 4-like [Macadamia integrifolia]